MLEWIIKNAEVIILLISAIAFIITAYANIRLTKLTKENIEQIAKEKISYEHKQYIISVINKVCDALKEFKKIESSIPVCYTFEDSVKMLINLNNIKSELNFQIKSLDKGIDISYIDNMIIEIRTFLDTAQLYTQKGLENIKYMNDRDNYIDKFRLKYSDLEHENKEVIMGRMSICKLEDELLINLQEINKTEDFTFDKYQWKQTDDMKEQYQTYYHIKKQLD